jgi:hypothetical protein
LNDVFNVAGDGYSVSFSSDLRVVDSVDDIGETDHVFQVVEQSNFTGGAIANATSGGLNIKIGTNLAKETILGENTRSIAHEVGHTAGLGHPNEDKTNSINHENWPKNLMIQSKVIDLLGVNPNNARDLTSNQITQMWNNYERGSLNKDSLFKHKISGINFVGFPAFLPIPSFRKTLR